MAAIAILEQVGVECTVDWAKTDLNDKLRFACGTPEFLEAVTGLVPYGTTFSLD
jgi:myo-inositol-1(or 4)-monophosphatase